MKTGCSSVVERVPWEDEAEGSSPSNLTNIICSNCYGFLPKKIFKHYRYNQKNGHKTYCSIECRNKARELKKEFKCGNCSTSVFRTRSEFLRSKSSLVFCSRSCSTSISNKNKIEDKNPNYRHGAGSYRKRALSKYGLKCANITCPLELAKIKIPEKLYEVDHIDSNRKNNKLVNLQVLCIFCHRIKTLEI